MKFSKLHPKFGIKIKDIKINKITKNEIVKILSLFEKYSLLVVNNQKITNLEQLEFAKKFGKLEITKPGTIGSNSNLVILTNINNQGKVVDHNHKQAKNDRANQQWHSDSSFKIQPAKASILIGKIVPKKGGNTEFICMRNIYNELDLTKQKIFNKLNAIHHFAHSRSKIDPNMISQIEQDKFPPVIHPMVKVNPVNKKKAIYFGSHTSGICNVNVNESSNLLSYLNKFINNKKFIYSHKWSDNDLIIWDNRCMIHRGQPYDVSEPRRLVRATTVDIKSRGFYLN